MKVYVDKDFKCHTTDDGTMIIVDSEFFDGKCAAFIEGYCCEAAHGCEIIYPWKHVSALDIAQGQYEADRAALAAAYREGVNSL